jgi:CubicO group peptidase (beta-lactamase class C family)
MLSLVAALFAAVPATTDRIDDIIIEQMKVSHLPGVAVAIVDHGRVTKLATYGEANLEWPGKWIPIRASSSPRRPSCLPESC